MAITTQTQLASIALGLIGEPAAINYSSDVGTTADLVRLHLPLVTDSLLASHAWSFATRTAALNQASLQAKFATALMDGSGNNNILFTALASGPAGNELNVTLATPTGASTLITGTAAAMVIIPKTGATVNDVITAWNADAVAKLLAVASIAAGSIGTAVVTAVAATPFTGGAPASAVYDPAATSAYTLPADCLRLLKINGSDPDVPCERFAIAGRILLLTDAPTTAPVIEYISSTVPISEWPASFVEALCYLLAARIATTISHGGGLADAMLAEHERFLGKARSRDTRETRSNENFGPRQLAARSGLVNARYGSTRPPY